ncbi:MAG: galactokinase [Candidatus Puniceispirillaceae bacterium]
MPEQTHLSEAFKDHFGHPAEAEATAHGRVNLIGEHTDYCDGFVMPTLIRPSISVALSLCKDGQISGVSDGFEAETVPLMPVATQSWLRFVQGAVHYLNEKGADIQGVNLMVASDIPAGAGVSSSAALEIALLRALTACTKQHFCDEELAVIGRQIEHHFVGTQCGIMDQMAVAKATLGEALFLDCRSHEAELVLLPASARLVVIHSGSSRSLSSSLYNERLKETQLAAKTLGLSSLRDAKVDDFKQISDALIAKRARHVITENQRVLDAKQALMDQELETLGMLMNQSHRSLAEDYEVSSAELDHLVMAAHTAGAYGARLTGAGFGGCIIALMPAENLSQRVNQILKNAPASWLVDISD